MIFKGDSLGMPNIGTKVHRYLDIRIGEIRSKSTIVGTHEQSRRK
jgi:hypothetical protein